MKFYTVYKTVNKTNRKYYIGKHITDDPYDGYLGSGKHLKRAIKKYGEESFQKFVLYIFDNEKEMSDKEEELVNEQFVKDKNVYNITIGGKGGFYIVNKLGKNIYLTHKEKSRENIKIAKKSFDKKLKNDKIFYNNFCKSVSVGLKKLYENGHINPFRGKRHTDETKRKIGEKSSKRESGKGNSQYGTCWIYSDIEKKNKKIKKDDLNEWLNKGWNKGIKMIYHSPIA